VPVEHCKILHQINLESRISILIRPVTYFISTLESFHQGINIVHPLDETKPSTKDI
jgi:hypothetical protein